MQFRIVDIMDIHAVLGQAKIVQGFGILRILAINVGQMIIGFHDIFIRRMQLFFPHVDGRMVSLDGRLIISQFHGQICMQRVCLRQQILASGTSRSSQIDSARLHCPQACRY